MFYNITRHLLKSISNLIILTFGFAFGFFIMHHRTDSHSFQVSSRYMYYGAEFDTLWGKP